MRHFSINLIEVVSNLAAETGLDQITKEYVLQRLKSEGVTFLTTQLPKLSKAVLQGLELGYFPRENLTCFAWKNKSLRYFRSFLDGIFDRSTGRLLDEPSASAVANLRQFCEYFYKLALAFDQQQLEKAEEKYVLLESEMTTQNFEPQWVDSLRKNLETHYHEFCRTHVSHVLAEYAPRFGPGAFSESNDFREPFWLYKLMPSSKIGLCARVFRAFSGLFKSYPNSREAIKLVDAKSIAKIEYVPKDSRGPRVISKEPLHLIKAQMSYFDWASSCLEKITRGRIQFTDQTVNKNLAKSGSITRKWSTLDLKDASDRVSYSLMSQVFRNAYAPRYFISKARSTHVQLKSGKVIPIRKLAGMGSGITFPTMALLIHLSICTSITTRTRLPYSDVMQQVFVYGDDVIVPTKWVLDAKSGLSRSGLCINADKSFASGFFRESCGGDYFKGVDVTPVRLRLAGAGLGSSVDYRNLMIRIKTDGGLLQVDRHARELRKKGFWALASYYETLCEKSLGGVYPNVSGDSPVLGRYVDSVNTDIPVKGYMPAPQMQRVEKQRCPYKYLGQFFARVDSEDTTASTFSLSAVSRKVRLVKRLVHGVNLR